MTGDRTEPPGRDTGERDLPAGLHTDPERPLLLGMLEWHREGVVHKVTGLAAEHLSVSPVRSGATVGGIVKHLAYVEDAWFTERIAGRPPPEPWASAPFDADPDWEWHSAGGQSPTELLALYTQACERSRRAVAGLDLDVTAVTGRGTVFSVRFALLHLIEETARHLGHLDVLRELLDGTTGE